MDFREIITYIIGISGGLGAAYGFFQKSKAETLITLQAQENQALQGQNSRLKEENQALLGENRTLKNSNQDLKELAQQTPDVRILTSKIADVAVSVATITKHLGITNGKKPRTD